MNKAVELIKSNPKGLRYSELQRGLQSCFPDTSPNTITESSWNLDVTRSEKTYKPTRGLFKYRLISEEETERTTEEIPPTLREEDFYKPFANCLKTDLGECTEAVVLGGSYLGKRWETPDVIGIYKPLKRDVIKFEPEIISADTERTMGDEQCLTNVG